MIDTVFMSRGTGKDFAFMRKKYSNILALIFIVFGIILLCLEHKNVFSNITNVYMDLDIGGNGEKSECIKGESTLSEEFFSDSAMRLKCIAIRTITWNRHFRNDDLLYIDIYEKDTNKLIDSRSIHANKLPDNGMAIIRTESDLEANKWYTIRLSSTIIDGPDLCVMTGPVKNSSLSYMTNDKSKDICIVLFTE